MQSERHQVQYLIDESVLEVGDGYRAKQAELADQGLPFARAANIDGGFRFDGAELLGWPAVKKAGSKVSQPGDVVFTSKGTVGRFALVSKDTPRFAYSPQLCYWRSLDPEVLHPRYLYFWMNSWDFYAQVTAVKGQTDMADYVSLRDQRRMEVPIPLLAEQRRIADVLGALDDRIEVNRRMNRTLEAMAQALFRSRFVSFDGRGDLVESEAGPIPEGWRWGKPADLITFDPRMKLKKGTIARYLGMSEVPTEGFEVGELEERPYKGGSKFVLGDTLLARITPSLENGKAALVDFLESGEVGFGSTEFIVMRSQEGTPREFVYCLARSPEFRQFAIKHMTGSSGWQRVSRDDFSHYDMPVPPRNELATFATDVRPLFKRISLNHRHSRTLAALRDALLPKLVSGEIRVPEAEVLADV